nr:MAG TPA: hypothetical protein [Siphoviridae sp. ctedi74]DAZ37314.1 MAG TPA: hypothetical protein [Caudoviricetes sp.]
MTQRDRNLVQRAFCHPVTNRKLPRVPDHWSFRLRGLLESR